MEYDAFISHSSEDKLMARLIRGYLRSHNIHSWFDEFETALSDSVADQDISDKLNPAIEHCRYFLLITSRSSMNSRWVEAEARKAYELRQQGLPIHLVGLLIEPITDSEKPDWMRSIRHLDISGVYKRVDRLKELRDKIGATKATYISDVEPNFFKQIPISKLSDHLVKCPGNDLSMWFIDAGLTFGHYIVPALNDMMSRRPFERFTCRVLLMDSHHLPGNTGLFNGAKRAAQRFFDRTIRDSEFITNKAPHVENVKGTRQKLENLASLHKNFSYELRLTFQMPAGRMIFASGIGFYGPHIEYSAVAPFLIFDNNSPFFGIAEKHFDQAYQAARQIPPGPRWAWRYR